MQTLEHRNFAKPDETRSFPGTLRIQMADGTQFDAGLGDVTSLPSGHDAWGVGDEPVVTVDWFGATDYARQA